MNQRVIPEDSGDVVQRWQAPDVGAPARARPPVRPAPKTAAPPEAVEQAPPPLTLEQIEAIQREAHEEGLRQGEAEGRRLGTAAVRAEAETLRRVLESLTPFVAGLDQRLEQELVTLATVVARQLVRRELRTDPGQIVAAVREALAVLPSSERRVRLHLHPEDVPIVRDALHLAELEQPWKVIEDPSLSRGGARLETETSQVDATVESRLHAVIAEMWGGERRDDGTEAGSREPSR
ncbi:flagellar assembly protein FliH [Thioalkalivibrio sp.]|uniref:flagellar assembly protein FliH n=1 Tax=Thioalkalivibrio sp. TaxID=2093813 RepID=UPI0039749D1E